MENDVILFVNFVHIKTPCCSMAPLWVDRVSLSVCGMVWHSIIINVKSLTIVNSKITPFMRISICP